MPFEIDFFLEAFGYLGTALVILSMLMTSVVKLRIINMCGSVISTIYAAISGAWPIVLLNVSLFLINLIQLIRMKNTRSSFSHSTAKVGESCVQYFLSLYDADIKTYFPEYTVPDEASTVVEIAYIGSETVGLLIGEKTGDTMTICLDYATPKYRDLSVSTFLFSKLAEEGIRTLIAPTGVPEHQSYLLRMGFTQEGERMIKQLNVKEKTI